MRRKDREITDFNEIVSIISKCQVCRLALNNGDYPYIIPLNFGFEASKGKIVLYFHSAKTGTKLDLINKNNKASVEMDCETQLIVPTGKDACDASMAFESVIGKGEIEFVEPEEKEKALLIILKQYNIAQTEFNPMHLANTKLYKLVLSSFTAKRKALN